MNITVIVIVLTIMARLSLAVFTATIEIPYVNSEEFSDGPGGALFQTNFMIAMCDCVRVADLVDVAGYHRTDPNETPESEATTRAMSEALGANARPGEFTDRQVCSVVNAAVRMGHAVPDPHVAARNAFVSCILAIAASTMFIDPIWPLYQLCVGIVTVRVLTFAFDRVRLRYGVGPDECEPSARLPISARDDYPTAGPSEHAPIVTYELDADEDDGSVCDV